MSTTSIYWILFQNSFSMSLSQLLQELSSSGSCFIEKGSILMDFMDLGKFQSRLLVMSLILLVMVSVEFLLRLVIFCSILSLSSINSFLTSLIISCTPFLNPLFSSSLLSIISCMALSPSSLNLTKDSCTELATLLTSSFTLYSIIFPTRSCISSIISMAYLVSTLSVTVVATIFSTWSLSIIRNCVFSNNSSTLSPPIDIWKYNILFPQRAFEMDHYLNFQEKVWICQVSYCQESFYTYQQQRLQFTFQQSKALGFRVWITKQPSQRSFLLLEVFMDQRTIFWSQMMCQVKISLISYLGTRELLQILWIFPLRYFRRGSVAGLVYRFYFTFLIRSSRNIFMMLKSFFKFSMILFLNGDSWKDLNSSSLNKVQSPNFPSFSLMNDLKIIAHWYFESTNRILSAFSSETFNDPSSKHSYSLMEIWLMNTALFLLNRKYPVIFLMASFIFSLASCFFMIDLQISSYYSVLTTFLASYYVTSLAFSFYCQSSYTFSTTLFSLKYIQLALWEPMMLFLGNCQAIFMLCFRVATRSCFLGLNTQDSKIYFHEIRSFSSYSSILLRICQSPLLFKAIGNFKLDFLLITATSSLKDFARQGGLPNSNSYMIIPVDHTSHLLEYCIPFRICGHMYRGLPTDV